MATKRPLIMTALVVIVALLPLLFDASLAFKDGYELIKRVFYEISIFSVAILALILPSSRGLTLRRSAFDLPILFFLGAVVLSLLTPIDLFEGLGALRWLTATLLAYALIGGSANLDRDALFVMRLVSLSGCLIGCYGILQQFSIEITSLQGNYDPIATLGHRNVAAEVLILFIPIAFAWFLSSGSIEERAVAGSCSGIMGVHLLFTKSRGAWMGAVAELIVIGLFLGVVLVKAKTKQVQILHRNRVLVVVFGLIVGVLIASTGYSYGARFLSSFDVHHGTARFRLLTWGATLRMIKDYPICGVGWGSYGREFPKYRSPQEIHFSGESTIVDKTHNDHLQYWAELGAPGLAAWLLLLLVFVQVSYTLFKGYRPDPANRFTVALIVACVGILVTAFFSFGLSYSRASSAIFWVYLGFIGVAYHQATAHRLSCLKIWHAPFPAVQAIGIGLLILLTVYWGHNPLQGARWFRRGENYRAHEQHREAIAALNQAARYLPRDYRIHHQLAYSYEALGRLVEAEQAEQKSVDLFPLHRDGYFNLGYIYERREEWEKAADYYRKALEIYPENLAATNNLAVMLQKLNRNDEALAVAEKGLTWHPFSPDLHNNLGVCYFRLQQYAEAAARFKRVTELRNMIIFPETTITHYALLGEIQFRITVKDGAGKTLIQATDWGRILFKPGAEQAPQIENPARGGAFSWVQEQRVLILKFEDIPSADLFYVEYKLRGVTGSFDYRQGERVYAKAYNNLGQCYQQLQNYAEAELAYQAAIRVDPAYPSPYCNAGYMHLQFTARLETARAYLLKCRELAGEQAGPGLKRLEELTKIEHSRGASDQVTDPDKLEGGMMEEISEQE